MIQCETQMRRGSYIKVNLCNVAKNYKQVQSLCNMGTVCSAVIKADAYGLGIDMIAPVLFESGCRDFWVFYPQEADGIRGYVCDSNVYVLRGANTKEELIYMMNNKFIPVISDITQFQVINDFIDPKLNTISNNKIDVVLNFETGLGRDGISYHDITNELLRCCNVIMIMSHLSCAEDKNHPLNQKQLNNMQAITKLFPGVRCSFCNSDGMLLGKQYQFDMVRVGGAIYGITPKDALHSMQPVVEFYAPILYKKTLLEDSYIGYDATNMLCKGSRVFVLDTGYYHGYRTTLSNKSSVYAGGVYLPIIGIISMNLTLVNASALSDELYNSITEVELIGKNVTIEEIAEVSCSRKREVLTGIFGNCDIFYEK